MGEKEKELQIFIYLLKIHIVYAENMIPSFKLKEELRTKAA